MSRRSARRGVVALAALVSAAVSVEPARARQARDAGGPPTSTSSAGTAVIAGTVMLDSGRPARRALVRLAGVNPSVSRTTVADDQGVFTFKGLPASTYTLTATKPGVLEAIFGQKTPGSGRPGTPIQLGDGQRLERIEVRMSRGGVLTGTVVDEFGDPAFGVSVRALRYVLRSGTRTLATAGTALTDDRGVYRLPSLTPGEYVLTASARDVMTVARASEERLVVAELAELELFVRARAVQAGSGVASPPRVVAPSAAPPEEPTEAYTAVHYPGSASGAAAVSVPLTSGEERSGLDMQLLRVPVARVTGTILSPPGSTLISEMQLVDRNTPLPGQGVRFAILQPDGSFAFTGVPPGQYTILAFGSMPSSGHTAPPPGGAGAPERGRTPAAPRDSLFATLDITTTGQPMDRVVLSLQPAMTVGGSVTFEGGRPGDLTKVTMRTSMMQGDFSAMAVDPVGPSTAAVDAAGRFTLRNVLPGRYMLAASGALGNFSMKSAVARGRDILDFPLEVNPGEDVPGVQVTFTTRVSELAGSLVNGAGAPAPDHTVVVFAADSRYWTPQSRRIQAARPATDGRFVFKGLPAGDYRLVAVSDVEPGQWFVPEYLRELVTGSIAVTLGDGEKKIQALRVTR